jgi:hypothetical protein
MAARMSNPAIHPQPNGDVDIEIPAEEKAELKAGNREPQREASVDPDNLDHPEELMGE